MPPLAPHLDDTIAAISSPPGAAARGVIRLSGPDAIPIAAHVLCCRADASVDAPVEESGDASNQPKSLSDVSLHGAPGHYRLLGTLRLNDRDASLPIAAWVFRAPRSYTREDVVELHLPGGPGLLALVMDALLAAGARSAERGEFTLRALCNGALDIEQVQGVADAVAAQSDAQLRGARRLLDGALSRDAAAARNAIADLRALVEAALDFADEDIEFITPAELATRLDAISARLRATAASHARIDRPAAPPCIVLAGPPNAGKSTLLNRLSGLDRAICSPLAGTTRDVLCAPIQLPHGQALLCDTAGLFESIEPSVSDGVAARADAAARKAIDQADVIVWMTARNEPVRPPRAVVTACAGRMMYVTNKCDLTPPAPGVTRSDKSAGPLAISALTGDGVNRLAAALDQAVHWNVHAASDALTMSIETARAINDAIACIGRAADLARASGDGLAETEFVAADLIDAGAHLGRLAGDIALDEVYDRIFSRFCIGK